jgi:membrane protease YdiL (CAAX protease family)
MNARQRTAALLEVLGVYLAGQLVTGQMIRLLGIRPINPLVSLSVGVTDAELITATWQLFVLLTLQYSGWFLLIIPINYWHRRQGPAAYGLTRAGHSWSALIVAGLATAALCLWPTLAVDLANAVHPIGETAPWRQALFDTSWRRWQFWLFTAVLSWGLVAVVEEIFFRGYCQRRLAEDWGTGAAIAGVTCLFIFSHTQYLEPNAYNAAKIPSLLLAALGSGVVFAWTRSLVPSVVAHAISNLPMTPFWQGVVVAALVGGAVVTSRRGAAVVRQVFSDATVVGCIVLGVVGAGYAIASARVEGFVFVAAAMVVLAVFLEAMDKRRERAAEPVGRTSLT